VDANLSRVASVFRALSGRADLLVLPETFLQGYHAGVDALRATAVTADSPALARVAALAREHACACAMPFAEAATDGSGAAVSYNSVALFDADGALLRIYRKCHLWDPDGTYERRAFHPGPGVGAAADPFTPVTLAAWPQLPIGLLVCWDLEFPEPARALAVAGARVIISVHASGEARGFTSTHYAPVRAFENDVALVYVNYPSTQPPSGGAFAVSYSGGSAVVAPDGQALYALPVYACDDDNNDDDARGRAPPHAPRRALSSAAHDAVGSAAAVDALQPLGPDEHVFIVAVDVDAPVYAHNRAARNPYLRARRAELYGGLLRRDA